jgi:hypothetical protein
LRASNGGAPSAETLLTIDQLLDRGNIDPSGLNAPEAVQARIARMPMLAWKAQNVRAHRGAR